jgi:long-chain acyl-CoA synthetase
MRAGDAVAVATRNRHELLEVYFAAMQAGFYYVPVPPQSTADELSRLLDDSGAKALVFDATAAPAVRGDREACFALDDTGSAPSYESLKRNEPSSAPADRVAGEVFPYTSGTTGRRRGVRRPLSGVSPEERARMAALHLRAAADIRAGHAQVHLVCAPLCFGAALVWCTDHLHCGHPVVLMDRFTAESALELIERRRITSSFMVPTHFRRLLVLRDTQNFDVSSLRHIVHSGAPCAVALKQRMMEWWGPVLYETYAATEGPGTQIGPQEWLEHRGAVGRAGSRIKVLRADGTDCDAGEVGRVFLLSERPFEYHADPEKTAKSRVGDYFTVGDIGYIDDDGYLFLCDRGDDVVISGGVNIYPAEVEALLSSHAAVADVGAFGVPDDEWGERLIAAVVPHEREPSEALAEELAAFCSERLAGFKCPRVIAFHQALPRDENGKLSRLLLREQYGASEAMDNG